MTDNNHDLFHKAQQFIPGGVNSPVRAFKGVGGEPLFIAAAKGPHMIDVNGKSYIDYIGSWGPMIAGTAMSGCSVRYTRRWIMA